MSADLADLLTRLGIRSSEMGLEIKAVYQNGVVIPRQELILDIESYKERLTRAFGDAFQLALKAAYPTAETTATLLSLAAQNAKKVALEADYITQETAVELIARANAQAVALAKAVGRAQAQAKK